MNNNSLLDSLCNKSNQIGHYGPFDEDYGSDFKFHKVPAALNKQGYYLHQQSSYKSDYGSYFFSYFETYKVTHAYALFSNGDTSCITKITPLFTERGKYIKFHFYNIFSELVKELPSNKEADFLGVCKHFKGIDNEKLIDNSTHPVKYLHIPLTPQKAEYAASLLIENLNELKNTNRDNPIIIPLSFDKELLTEKGKKVSKYVLNITHNLSALLSSDKHTRVSLDELHVLINNVLMFEITTGRYAQLPEDFYFLLLKALFDREHELVKQSDVAQFNFNAWIKKYTPVNFQQDDDWYFIFQTVMALMLGQYSIDYFETS